MLGPDDLVLCSATLMGVPLREKAAAASAAGYTGITLWPSDYAQARESGLSDTDMRSLLDDHGLGVGEIDPLVRWLDVSKPGPDAPAMARGMYGPGVDDLCNIAIALGARSINVVEVFGIGAPVEVAAEAFGRVCDRAAQDGLIAHLEFFPWGGFPDLKTAWDVVRTADRPNGGINVDTWHFTRSGSSLDLLRSLPQSAVRGLQINDVLPEPVGELVVETMESRLCPGEGAADVVGVLRALDEIGSDAPIGVEVMSRELRELPPAEAAQRCADATRAVLARARA